jgi:hypothetical protein
VAVPSLSAQVVFVAVALAVRAVGWVTVSVRTVVQPLASVAVTLYPPAQSPVALDVVCPFDQAKLIAPVPPVAETVATAVQLPLQRLFVLVTTALSAVGWLMTTFVVAVQLLASVAVTVYVPAHNPVFVAVALPFDQAKVTAPVPPALVATAVPLQTPLQLTFVLVAVTDIAQGDTVQPLPTVATRVVWQPLASVILTV